MIQTPLSRRSCSVRPASDGPLTRWFLLAAGWLLLGQAGCTAVSSTAALRDAVLDTLEGSLTAADSDTTPRKTSASGRAEAAVVTTAGTERSSAGPARHSGDDEDAGPDAPGEAVVTDLADEADANGLSDNDSRDESDRPAENPEVRQRMLVAAVDGAIERLADVGGLDDAARTTLLATLEETPSDDWPAVIEAFASSLESTTESTAESTLTPSPVATAAAVVVMTTAPEPADARPATTDEPTAAVADPQATAAAATTPGDASAPTAEGQPAAPVVPEPPRSSLAVLNACFASRVVGWGSVERFAADRFTPGQEVIVYFELANLATNETAAGHTTSIDTVLRLVAPDGRRLHEWSFHPIDETCRSRRQDYFVRYLVQFPAELPAGPCRLELSVTDAVAARTAQTSLPLEIAAAE